MKPFNLEEAKAGKALVTRSGVGARFVAHVPEAAQAHRVIVMCDDSKGIVVLYENGRYLGYDHPFDLFMAPEKISGWVNLYRSDSVPRTGEYLYATKEAAEANADVYVYLGSAYVELEV